LALDVAEFEAAVAQAAAAQACGESEFKGTPNNLVWAGKWQAKL